MVTAVSPVPSPKVGSIGSRLDDAMWRFPVQPGVAVSELQPGRPPFLAPVLLLTTPRKKSWFPEQELTGVPPKFAACKASTELELSQPKFEKRIFDLAKSYADLNAPVGERYEYLSKAKDLVLKKYCTTKREDGYLDSEGRRARIADRAFIDYVGRVMGYLPIRPDLPTLANGWEVSEDSSDSPSISIMDRESPGIGFSGSSKIIPGVSLDKKFYQVYVKGDWLYVSKPGAIPDGKSGVDLAVPLGSGKTEPKPVVLSTIGAVILGKLTAKWL